MTTSKPEAIFFLKESTTTEQKFFWTNSSSAGFLPLIIASLAKGKTIIKQGLIAEDQEYAMKAMTQFGAKIKVDKSKIINKRAIRYIEDYIFN